MKFWSTSLVSRLVAYFVLLVVLTVSLVGGLAYVLVRRNLTNAVYERLDAVLDLKADELQRWIKAQRQEVAFLAGSDVVQQWSETLIQEERGSDAYNAAYQAFSQYLRFMMLQKTGLQEIFIVTELESQVLIASDEALVGTYVVAEYVDQGRARLYIQSVYKEGHTGEARMTIAAPLFGADQTRIGVVVAHLNLDRMHEILLERPGLGPRGETYLLDYTGSFIVQPHMLSDQGPSTKMTEAMRVVLSGQDGQGVYDNYEDTRVIGAYRWLADYNLALIAEIDEAYAITRPAQRVSMTLLGSSALLGVVLIAGVYILLRQIVQPLQLLTTMALRVAEGDLEQAVPVFGQDEVGVLARTFNQMTAQLRDVYANLEQEVQTRTQALERRSRQLEAAAHISNVVAAIYDVERLLDETVRLIPGHFGLDHAGIFIVDEAGEYAVLQAASSEGGQQMLARGHKLKLGQGIVGQVALRGEARIALDVGEDADFVPNPDMLLTRSELAVPLQVRESVIGVLDVQSHAPAAFTEQDASVLQTMAEQVALAIQNAQLLRESERALRELERRYGEQSRGAWQARLADQPLAYHYTGVHVEPLAEDVEVNLGEPPASQVALTVDDDGLRQLIAPIRMRNQVLGTIVLRQNPEDTPWSEADVALLEATCDQIGLALDNARLLEASLAQASRERAAAEVTARIRASATDVDAVLQTTLRELGQLLHATGKVYVRGLDVSALSVSPDDELPVQE